MDGLIRPRRGAVGPEEAERRLWERAAPPFASPDAFPARGRKFRSSRSCLLAVALRVDWRAVSVRRADCAQAEGLAKLAD